MGGGDLIGSPAAQLYSAAMLELPPSLQGPAVWRGPEIATRGEWIEPLSAGEIDEIEAAVMHNLQRDIASVRAAQFVLPTLAPRLARIRHEVLNGRGFALLRGLPVQRWTMQQSALAFFGIGMHFGAAVSQNAKGHVLGHVQDLGLDANDPNVRIYQTHERQTFHTDSCDIVGLLCLQVAQSGGDSALVSSSTIWNEMRARAPELAALLLQPIATDRRGEVPAGELPYFTIPVFNWHLTPQGGQMSAIYQRQYIDSAQRFASAPRLTPQHVRALDLFDELANDPALHFLMTLQPGDVQLVHNHTLLHDRTAFTDWPEPERRRHLLRLWLAPADARPLPPVFAQRYGSVVPGARGGVPASVPLNAPLAAV
jgi:alpha-ketoglutarate-dependent taurine dioxygenase